MTFPDDLIEIAIEVEFYGTAGASFVADAFAVRQEGAVAVSGAERVGGGVSDREQAQAVGDIFIV